MTENPENIVRQFLAAIAARDVDGGQRLLASEARIVFPGGASRSNMADIVSGSSAKYRRCEKTFERFDCIADGNDMVVYCFGTLHGQLADGRNFDGVRYVDRFVVRDNLICEQQVWNDMASSLG
ncbi:MAG: ketosteroid isomerase-like protein [Gammaproteobacteria bacterium]|jgi:ketosteroid isomerase-like protein